MNWFDRLRAQRENTTLTAANADALRCWQALPAADSARAHFETRYTVVNTEASGLDLEHDRLLAVAAIAIDNGLLDPEQSYYAALETDAETALLDLLVFAGKGPLVVFNADFNRGMLERAWRMRLGIEAELPWIDLHFLLPALFPERIEAPARLADWMAIFGIETFQRHHALGDAWAIAQLFLAAQARALQSGAGSARALIDLERSRRQLWRHR